MRFGKLLKHSLECNGRGIILIVFSALIAAVGQLCWKISVGEIGLMLIIGFLLYGFAALIMILAFRYGSLSVLHPILSVSYIAGLLLGVFFLNEIMTARKIIGIMVIMSGIIFITRGDG